MKLWSQKNDQTIISSSCGIIADFRSLAAFRYLNIYLSSCYVMSPWSLAVLPCNTYVFIWYWFLAPVLFRFFMKNSTKNERRNLVYKTSKSIGCLIVLPICASYGLAGNYGITAGYLFNDQFFHYSSFCFKNVPYKSTCRKRLLLAVSLAVGDSAVRTVLSAGQQSYVNVRKLD